MGVYCHAYEEAKTHIAELIHNHRVHAARLIDERIVLKERIAELEAREQKNLAEERQRVIDGLCTIGETAWEIEEYMKEWDAKHPHEAATAGIGVNGE